MANKRIQDLPAKGATIAANDILEVSEYQSPGVYTSKKILGSELGGVTTFEALTDTPAYSGNALKVVRVNAGENALEYATITANSGRFGIADSSGVYTYYTTLTLAMTAATSGQTIEFFTDYTETGAVTITLKDGVTINGNGHTYTCTSAGAGLKLFDNVTNGKCNIFNLIIDHTSANSSSVSVYLSNGSFNLEGSIFKKTAGFGLQAQGGIVNNGTFNVTGTCVGVINQGGTIDNIRAYSVNGTAINNVGGSTRNSYAVTTGTGIAIYGNNIHNCQGFASAGYGAYLDGNSSNVYAFSSGSVGVLLIGGNHSELVAVSNGNVACQVQGNNVEVNGFRFTSTASYGMFTQFVTSTNLYTNGVIQSSVSSALYSTSQNDIYSHVYFRSTLNTSSGHAVRFEGTGNNNEIINCTLQVANASANCINSSVAITTKYANNAFKGATTAVNANITQGVSNTHDSQGNILI